MKSEQKIIAVLVVILFVTIGMGKSIHSNMLKKKTVSIENDVVATEKSNQIKEEKKVKLEDESKVPEVKPAVEDLITEVAIAPVTEVAMNPIVYDGLTMTELSSKLDRSLGSTLAGTGYSFATYSLELGVDPYLATAIVLHETGCTWDCSYLVKACNNVGGMKGTPGCGGGSYASFTTLDEGIRSYISNLSRNYYARGLTSPETIGPVYAASPTWASKINYYINSIKNK